MKTWEGVMNQFCDFSTEEADVERSLGYKVSSRPSWPTRKGSASKTKTNKNHTQNQTTTKTKQKKIYINLTHSLFSSTSPIVLFQYVINMNHSNEPFYIFTPILWSLICILLSVHSSCHYPHLWDLMGTLKSLGKKRTSKGRQYKYQQQKSWASKLWMRHNLQ